MVVAAGIVLAVTLLALAVAGWSLMAAEERRQADRLRDDARRLAGELRTLAVETVFQAAPADRRLLLTADGARLHPAPPAAFAREPVPEDARLAFLLRQGLDDAAGPAAETVLATSDDPVVRLHLALRRALREESPAAEDARTAYEDLPDELRETERGVHLGLLGGHEDAVRRALRALSTPDDALAASLLVGALGRDSASRMDAERRRQTELARLRERALGLVQAAAPADADAGRVLIDKLDAVAVRRADDGTWSVAAAAVPSVEAALLRRAAGSSATLAGTADGEPLRWWPGRAVAVETTGLDGFRGLVLAGIGIAAAAAIAAFVAFVRAAERAARLAALRTEFVATVGHELRTPVAVIRTSAETLERGLATTDEQRAVFLGAILRESERLAGLLGNVLDFARMESGSERFRFERSDLCEIARDCVDARRESRLAAPGRVELVTPEQPVTVECDPRAVGAALANLVDNAVKFGGDREPVVVRVIPGDESSSPCVQVEDHGLGVPDEQKERIFERFYRDPRPAVQATRGTGIGLALCGRVAAAHGGELTVSDTPGGGATFRLVLPAVRRS